MAAAAEYRAFIREIVDLCPVLAADEERLLRAVAIVFAHMFAHPAAGIRAIAKPGTHYLQVIYSLMEHPTARIAELAIGTICKAVDAPFEPGGGRVIDVAGLPIASLRAHCETEGDPLAWASIQLIRALCRADPGYTAAHGIPEFLLTFIGVAEAYRMRSEATVGLVYFLVAADAAAFGERPIEMVRPLLETVLSSVEPEGPIANGVVWAIFNLKLKFSCMGLDDEIERVLIECDAPAFLEACQDLDREELTQLVEHVRSFDSSAFTETIEQLSDLKARIVNAQAVVDVAKGRRKLEFTFRGS
jgi:hypothetical protein